MTTISVTPTHFAIVDFASGEVAKYDNQQYSIKISETSVTIEKNCDIKTDKRKIVEFIEQHYDQLIAAILLMFPDLTFARLRENAIICIPLAKTVAQRLFPQLSEELIDFGIEALVYKLRTSAAPTSNISASEFDKVVEDLVRNPVQTDPPSEVVAMFQQFVTKPKQAEKIVVSSTQFMTGGVCPAAQISRTIPITAADISRLPTPPLLEELLRESM